MFTTEMKLDMIRVYLEKKVPYCEIENLYQDDGQGMHIFQLNCNGQAAIVAVSFAFIDDHSPADVLTTIMKHRLESYFRDTKVGKVVITHDGIKVVPNVN